MNGLEGGRGHGNGQFRLKNIDSVWPFLAPPDRSFSPTSFLDHFVFSQNSFRERCPESLG